MYYQQMTTSCTAVWKRTYIVYLINFPSQSIQMSKIQSCIACTDRIQLSWLFGINQLGFLSEIFLTMMILLLPGDRSHDGV